MYIKWLLYGVCVRARCTHVCRLPINFSAQKCKSRLQSINGKYRRWIRRTTTTAQRMCEVNQAVILYQTRKPTIANRSRVRRCSRFRGKL